MLISDLYKVGKWVSEKTECVVTPHTAAIGWQNEDGEITCGVIYDHFTEQSIVGTLAIKKGAMVPKQFIWAMFDYPFNQLGVGKVIAYAEDANVASVAALTKLGFILEAWVEGVFPSGGMSIYTMTKPTCRWLEKQNG